MMTQAYCETQLDHCECIIKPYVYNLTASYTDQRNEGIMVAATVVMFILAVLLFNLNLFSRFSDLSAILNPTIRLFLSTSFTLFLPVMSYLFSEAKNEGAPCGAAAAGPRHMRGELSLRARTILTWMLLVELIRKKVEAILVNVGMEWYSGTIDRAARIAWLGYLVFHNIKSTGKKAIFGILWVLAAAKLLQRVAINELLKRSAAYNKNAKLVDSYMAQKILPEQLPPAEIEGSELMKRCNYAVMGEDRLERTAGPKGYVLKLNKAAETNTDTESSVVTVGEIWSAADAEDGQLLQEGSRLKRLCLSFALFKVLRRRLEDLPVTGEETRYCRHIIFNGLCKEKKRHTEVALFQVLDEELQFLCEYYHSVLPVVLSNPSFFLANYILFPILVWAFCLLIFVACSNGDLIYALKSIKSDNYVISTGSMTLAACILKKISHKPLSADVLYSTVDLATTILLVLTFLYEQVWEFLVFIFSHWLIVSLLCEYTSKRRWHKSRILSGLIRRILLVRSKISQRNLCFKQFSVLGFCQLSPLSFLMVPNKAVPKEVKRSILEYVVAHIDGYDIDGHADPLNTGWSILESDKHRPYRLLLSPACEGKSVTEFILTCHIATTMLEVAYRPEKKKGIGPHRKVATTLSRYCAYLVAIHPEFLPEDKDGTERAYKEMKKELKEEFGGCWTYHLSLQRTRYKRLKEIGGWQETTTTVVHKGAKLGKGLIDMAKEDAARAYVWELLADLWTELIVYVAPSGGELHVKAHKEALAKGGEFITLLWALCTHTGITRPAIAPWEAARRAFQV